jgi:hypothetical protein
MCIRCIPYIQYKHFVRSFNAKVGREDSFKTTIVNERLHKISNYNGVGALNFATSKNFNIQSTMFEHCNTHKFNWAFHDGKSHKQVDHIVIER